MVNSDGRLRKKSSSNYKLLCRPEWTQNSTSGRHDSSKSTMREENVRAVTVGGRGITRRLNPDLQRAKIERMGTRTGMWFHEQFGALLRAVPDGYSPLLNWERKRMVIHAGRTALAAALCWWLALRLGLHEGYWGPISAIIVLQSNVGATIKASRDRILGTLIGAAFGFSFSLFGRIPWNYIAAVFLAVLVCGFIGFRNSSRLAGVTITIVMLVQAGSPKNLALDRVIEVVLGIVVAVAVTILILPHHARDASSELAEPHPGDDRQADPSE
jgi:uncharacterized membrane protein YccC